MLQKEERMTVKCDRCKKETMSYILSFFNLDMICSDCKEKEKAHPDYAKAVAAENEAVRNGDAMFPGIGKPGDL